MARAVLVAISWSGKVRAASFDNPDFVEITVHSYRHRHMNASGEERFIEVERKLAEMPRIKVPSITLRGSDSGFGSPAEDPSVDHHLFPNFGCLQWLLGQQEEHPTHGSQGTQYQPSNHVVALSVEHKRSK